MIKDCASLVVSNTQVAQQIFCISLKNKELTRRATCGQFVMLEVPGFFLRRPFCLADIDQKRGQFSLLYATVGEGTKALSRISVGQILSVVGPLGQGFEIVKKKKVLVIAGGLGSAAVMQLCKELIRHNSVDLYLGYKDYQSTIPIEFFPLGCNTRIATEDGSLGTTGLVTTILPEADGYDVIYLCGPLPMYKALLPSLYKHPKVFASFETRMGCGYGVCAGCSIRVGGKMRKVCHDGPVFLMHEVDLDCLV